MLGALATFPLFVVYPFVKRGTTVPQVWLGVCFSMNALVGSLAATRGVTAPSVALWAAGIVWTIGYDTGAATPAWVGACYVLTIAGLIVAGVLVGAGVWLYVLLAVGALHLTWQIATLDIDSPDRCLRLFVSNRWFGLTVVAAALVA